MRSLVHGLPRLLACLLHLCVCNAECYAVPMVRELTDVHCRCAQLLQLPARGAFAWTLADEQNNFYPDHVARST